MNRKYLIRSCGILYTVVNGELAMLPETEVSAALFQTNGMDELPGGALLLGLTDPEVLCWHASENPLPELTLTVSGKPPTPQVVISPVFDMSDSTILGIESVTVETHEDVLWAVSFDDGATWKAYNGEGWIELRQENSGMSGEVFQNIPLDAWAQVATGTQYRVRFILMSPDSYMTGLVIHYIN